ncbi:uncharacterized protein LOC118173806 [Oxyura jamaicensis]|uniref:uncharacterized protein LOC118173806 n=1 Tax=Oxyura jamaicensis TaxID=8884 RepID=UPI0015A5720D|nr:uncharacterized protein LOC118173806 [Oxyura jamaicensis]
MMEQPGGTDGSSVAGWKVVTALSCAQSNKRVQMVSLVHPPPPPFSSHWTFAFLAQGCLPAEGKSSPGVGTLSAVFRKHEGGSAAASSGPVWSWDLLSSSKHLVGKHARPCEGGEYGVPFSGGEAVPCPEPFPCQPGAEQVLLQQGESWRGEARPFPLWEPPLVAGSLGCFLQGPCWLAPGTLLSKVRGVTDEPSVFPSPVAGEGTHPLFGRWVTFNPAGQGRPRDPSVTLLLTTARGSGAAELSLLAPRETRGQGQDFFPGARAVLCHPYSSTGLGSSKGWGARRRPGAVLCPRCGSRPCCGPAGRGEDGEQRGTGVEMLEQTPGPFYSACMEISRPVPGWRGSAVM